MYMSETKKKLFNEQKMSRNVSVRVSEMSVHYTSVLQPKNTGSKNRLGNIHL